MMLTFLTQGVRGIQGEVLGLCSALLWTGWGMRDEVLHMYSQLLALSYVPPPWLLAPTRPTIHRSQCHPHALHKYICRGLVMR